MQKCDKIVDINSFTPINNNTPFFLDTNALFWYCYPRVGLGKINHETQYKPYQDFIGQLISNENPLFTSIYNVGEMLGVIEGNEFRLFKENPNNEPEGYNIKDFRAVSSQRSIVKNNLNTALINVENICEIIEFPLEKRNLKAFIDELGYHRLDFFDYITFKHCILDEKINIITDDSDFAYAPGIKVYTSNEKILNLR